MLAGKLATNEKKCNLCFPMIALRFREVSAANPFSSPSSALFKFEVSRD